MTNDELYQALLNDPVVSKMCDDIRLQEQHDLQLLTDSESESYSMLRAKGHTHGDAIWYIRRAASLERALKGLDR